jgi:hypothetical protein
VSQNLKRYLIIFFSIAVVYIIFLALFMESRAQGELDKARTFRVKEDYDAANLHYFRALNWYAPWGASQKAADELMELSVELLKKNLKKESFKSFIRLRSGLLAARSFYIPRTDLLGQANAIISLYLAESKLGTKANQTELRTQAEIYEKFYSINTIQNQFWYFIVIIGFFIWLLAVFWLIFVFFSDKNKVLIIKVKLKKARIPIALFAYGYALWIFGMSAA